MGDSILIDDFWGTPTRSPSGKFAIAHGILLHGRDAAEKHFVLTFDDRPLYRGTVKGSIERACVDDKGNFCLATLVGKERRKTALLFFRHDGTQYGRVYSGGFVLFIRIENDGNAVLFSDSKKVFLLNVSPNHTLVAFELPRQFYPVDGYVDNGSGHILLADKSGRYYRFDKSGKFLDERSWFDHFTSTADGPTLFYTIQGLYRQQEDWTVEQYRKAADYIAKALERGIEDSFHLKRSEVFNFLSVLRRRAGDEPAAATASVSADESLDGFRVVDMLEAQLADITREPKAEAIEKELSRLEEAEQYPRLARYPNYLGRLYKIRGSLYAAVEDLPNAIAALRRAIEVNPRVGCKKQLKALERRLAEIEI